MKLIQRISFILFFCVQLLWLNAQTPEGFKYQSIARDLAGLTINNSNISLRMSILDSDISGPTVYAETHSVSTNEFGLFSISIGFGTPVSGSFTGIDWATNEKFLKVEADFTGGTSFTEMGVSQLLSVPYALYSKYAENTFLPDGVDAGNTVFWNGTDWIVNNSNIFNNGSKVGIGMTNPMQKLDVNGKINIPKDSAYTINNVNVLSTRGLASLYLGEYSGLLTTFGQYNVFAGYNSGLNNGIGSQNTFIGSETGVSNLDGMMNSFLGRRAGFANTTGIENTFLGCYAGQSTTSGEHNSFLGVTTGNSNTTGNENTFLGAHAGYFNTTGNNNTYVGNFAGQYTATGSNNLYLGFNADGATSNLSNSIAIGSGSIVTASNTVIIGNTAMTSIGGQVGWSTFSDARLKKEISEETLGLNFILKLNPVRYKYIAKDQHGILYSGFIAQEVEGLLTELNTDFSGLVRPKNEHDFYSIRYAEFVVPIVKSVQEQQLLIEELQNENKQLQKELEEVKQLNNKLLNLEKRIEELEKVDK